ncbi:uncharacterized protein LOC133896796 isoform X2 [Phragmites australis]|uniref:uncharacterized protein LOC133896796 isoform X2 n=1 Tax=Phragmites australis TaxID=29695 RepID=UPI002D786E39|nr:uncharacterized protein LOC133896796 isoform X2 [Phragmites australis]
MALEATGDAAASSATGARGAASPAPTWRRVMRAGQGAAAHALLLCFTALLALKLDGIFSRSWWVLFIPLWSFHAVAARCRFSLPAPSSPQSGQQVPCHSIVATPLLVAFEILLCVYLEDIDGHGKPFIDLKLVFLPLLALEIITLVDNFRICGALMPGHGETITDEAIWERLPYFWVAISMVFLLAATSLMLLKLCGFPSALLFLYAQDGPIQWSVDIQSLDIGGPVLIIPIIVFQVLLCMRLEGTPSNARFIPVRAIFLPIILLQMAAVSFAIWRFFNRLVLKLQDRTISEGHISVSSKVDELFMMIQYGSRLLYWWSIDEDSKEEQARLCYANNIGYSTFCSYPPEVVKEMPKKVLVKEVQRLQLALEEQTEIANHSQQQCDRVKNERILCRICFERDICIVLLPCRHHVLCKPCSNKCQSCPICRLTIESRLSVYDAVMSADPLCEAV